MAAPAVVGVAGNSRTGVGAVSVTPPGSSTAWLAIVLDNGDTPSVTAATNFTLVGGIGTFTYLYVCTGSPGSSWTINGTGGDTGGVVLVIGYDRQISTVTPTTTAGSATSPTVTATEAQCLMRGIVGARSNDVAPGYPASAADGRGYDNHSMSGYFLMIAVAHQSVTAGATGTAAWTAGSGSLLGNDSWSVLVSEVVAGAPRPPTVIGAYNTPVAQSSALISNQW